MTNDVGPMDGPTPREVADAFGALLATALGFLEATDRRDVAEMAWHLTYLRQAVDEARSVRRRALAAYRASRLAEEG